MDAVMIKVILAIVAIIIILIAFWYFMIPYCAKKQKKEEYDWWIRHSKGYTASNEQIVTLDWRTVLSLYAVNPERWSIETIIQCRSDEDRIYTILLSYYDYLLYMAWREEKKQEERDNKEREAIKDILNCGQRDIERLRESIEENFKKAKETTNEIKERLEKEKK